LSRKEVKIQGDRKLKLERTLPTSDDMKAISSIRKKKFFSILGVQPISRYARHFKIGY